MNAAIPPPPTQRLLQLDPNLDTLRNFTVHYQGGNELQVLTLAGLFHEPYLEDQPIPLSKSHLEWPQPPTARSYRFFFRYHAARLLGWTEHRDEGDENGFAAAFNKLIRDYWPEEDIQVGNICKLANEVMEVLTVTASCRYLGQVCLCLRLGGCMECSHPIGCI
jgi:hypothetical protein